MEKFKKIIAFILFLVLPFFYFGCNKKNDDIQNQLNALRHENDSLASLRTQEDQIRIEQQKIAQEQEAMLKIANNVKYDVISQVRAFYKNLTSSATIEILDKNISINDRENFDKYFLINVDFKIEQKLFWDTKKECFTGKFYYNKSGNYYSSQWNVTSSEIE